MTQADESYGPKYRIPVLAMCILNIKLSKYKSKPTVLSCTREDGSVTWTSVRPGLELHDLAHYVLEKSLGWKDAFYGLLAKGYDISAFERPRDQRPIALLPKNLPQTSLIAEHIVNLLQVGFGNNNYDFFEAVQSVLQDKGLPIPPEFNPELAQQVQLQLEELWSRWQRLPAAGSLELVFSVE